MYLIQSDFIHLQMSTFEIFYEIIRADHLDGPITGDSVVIMILEMQDKCIA